MLVRADAAHLPLRDRSVDVVIGSPPSEWPMSDFIPIYEELQRVSRRSVVLVRPQPDDWDPGAGYGGAWTDECAARLIEEHTKPGDVVLDFCCGLGTLPRLATTLGRVGIGVELQSWIVERAAQETSR